VVEHAARYAVERAQQQKAGGDNLSWGSYVNNSVAAFLKSEKPATKTTSAKSKSTKK
jgi:hypothetical protein